MTARIDGMRQEAGETWTLTFVAEPGDVPVNVRVRHLLKRALRDWGLKCVNQNDVADQLRQAQAEVAEMRETIERVNVLARDWGWGQGELDYDLAECLRQTFERMEARHGI